MNIETLLKSLNISSANSGSSTGTGWLNTDLEAIISSSPVDGNQIASVFKTTRENYDMLRPLMNGGNGLPLKEVKS